MSTCYWLTENVSNKNPWDNKVIVSKTDFMNKTEQFARFNVKIVNGELPSNLLLEYTDSEGVTSCLHVDFSEDCSELKMFTRYGRQRNEKTILLAVMCVLGYPLIDEYSIEDIDEVA